MGWAASCTLKASQPASDFECRRGEPILNPKLIGPEPAASQYEPARADSGGLVATKDHARYGAGDVLAGRYRLETLAGEGSMGEVWLATNTALDLPVAIKLLRGDALAADARLALGDAFEEHLLREAKATAKLTHPSIVRVFDFGVTNLGDPFIVMERLDGEDLRDKLTRERVIEPESAVKLLLPVVHAMHAAHTRGIVHRDLKPENIFVALDDAGRDTPKVVDFGIAALPWASDGVGMFVAGTPAYMAPEQSAGDSSLDHRADVWSLAVVLYELVSGRVPFASSGDESFERDVLRGPDGQRLDDATALVPLGPHDGVDGALWAIIAKGLVRGRSGRWRSMSELGEALAEWLQARGVHEDCQGVSLRARWLYTSPSKRPPAVSMSPIPIPAAPAMPSGLDAELAVTAPLASTAPLAAADARPSGVDFVRVKSLPAPDFEPVVLPRRRVPVVAVVGVVIALVVAAAFFLRHTGQPAASDAAAASATGGVPAQQGARSEAAPKTDTHQVAPPSAAESAPHESASAAKKPHIGAAPPVSLKSSGRNAQAPSAADLSTKSSAPAATGDAPATEAPPPSDAPPAPAASAAPSPPADTPAAMPTIAPNGRIDPDGL